MVQKSRMRGHPDLNTGRTLRPALLTKFNRNYAFVSCSSMAASPPAVAAVRARLSAMGMALPPDGVEYSLNKRARWTIADRIREELLPAFTGDSGCQVELYEHHHRPFARAHSSCTAFSRSVSSLPSATTTLVQRTAERYMNAASLAAEASGRTTRRQRKLAGSRRNLRQQRVPGGTQQQPQPTATVVGDAVVRVVCDVVHSVPSESSAFHPPERRAVRLGTASTGKSKKKMIGKVSDLAFSRCCSAQECLDDLHGAPTDCCSLMAIDHEVADDEHVLCQNGDSYFDSACSSRPVSSQSIFFNLGDAVSHARTSRQKVRSLRIPNAATCDRAGDRRHEAPLAKRQRGESDMAAPAAAATVAAVSSIGDRGDQPSARLPVAAMEAAKSFLAPRLSAAAAGLDAGHRPVCIRLRGGHEGIRRLMQEQFGEPFWEECQCCVPALVTVPLTAAIACGPAAGNDGQRLQSGDVRPVEDCLVLQQQPTDPVLYCVWLATNSVATGVNVLRDLKDGAEYSAADLLAAAAAAVDKLGQSAACSRREQPSATASLNTFGILNSVRNWDVASKTLEEAYEQVTALCEVDVEHGLQQCCTALLPNQCDTAKNRNVQDWTLSDDPVVCCICLTNARDPEERAFALAACGHVCCFACWRAYVLDMVACKNGVLLCPAYRCNTPLCHPLVVALCGVIPTVNRRRRQMEAAVWRHVTAVWCPNVCCGRVLTAAGGRGSGNGEPAASIGCSGCGWTACFACQEEAHWPLTCRQATTYRERLHQRGLLVVRSPGDFLAAVQVATKPCPACHYPIEKAEGCLHMHCSKCSAEFCWSCLAFLSSVDRFSLIEHLNACLSTVADNGRDEEFAATSAWSKRSALSGKAMRHRAYRSASVSRALERNLAILTNRIKACTVNSYVASTGCAAASASCEDKLKGTIDRIQSVVLGPMLEAHCIAECSLACLALTKAVPQPPHCRNCTSSWNGCDAKLLLQRRRAVAEIGRLEFTLERLEELVMQLGDRRCRAPVDLCHLVLIDDLAAAGKRQLLSLVRLMTAFQGY